MRYSWRHDLEAGLSGPAGDPATWEHLRRVPKTDLHAHSLLSMPLEAVDALAGRQVDRPPERYTSFRHFTDSFRAIVGPWLSSLEAVRALTRAAFERMAAEGVVYAETSFELFVAKAFELPMGDYARMLIEERNRVAGRLDVCLELGFNRERQPADVEPQLARMLDEGVAGSLDLYGDETAAPGRNFVKLYDLARRYGLKLKAHAGEFGGPEEVRESIEVLGLHAVHHGVHAIEDPEVIRFLTQRGTVLHVCPTSNVKLGVAPGYASHPIRQLLEAGVAVTVNSDDFAFFGAGICDELRHLHHDCGLSVDQVETVLVTGLREAPAAIRERWLAMA